MICVLCRGAESIPELTRRALFLSGKTIHKNNFRDVTPDTLTHHEALNPSTSVESAMMVNKFTRTEAVDRNTPMNVGLCLGQVKLSRDY